MPVQHFNLDQLKHPSVQSTYLSTLFVDDEGPLDHPGSYTVSSSVPVTFHLYHGRFDPTKDMDDWGFDGPAFSCLSVAHDPDRILLQDADAQSLELAKRLGLRVDRDTITLMYHDDLVVVPHFRDAGPAYFGDHSATQQGVP